MPKPYTPNDAWSRKAAQEGYRARSVYKLMELDERFHLLKPGQTVLDLAAAPGSWLQYASKRIGPKGLAIGFDLTPIKPIAPNVITIQTDISDIKNMNSSIESLLKQHTFLTSLTSQTSRTFDLVLSDIAPSTSGIRDVDQWRSIELNQAVLAIAERWLKSGGHCVLKVFRGADFDAFLREVKTQWKDVRIATPRASRDRSKEVYLVMRKP
ncbi:MAG: RlmE family RNA methyltransferase [Candidatus Peribacteraceae bacterium]|nr:RlmE family RNA methyltransferase [Candidatus Peribacteraceae bacterium]MDD5742155.1 RlmE family RNA methyltransferase [Candidatus Peribacteraceae bacterium]